jgi:hypothetical protein
LASNSEVFGADKKHESNQWLANQLDFALAEIKSSLIVRSTWR